jgi:hypothetical protein
MTDMDRHAIARASADLARGDHLACDQLFTHDGGLPVHVVWRPTADDLKHAPLQFLLTHWTGHRRADRLPSHDIARPELLRPALGNIMLLDVLDDGWDYRYRVYGTRIAQASGFDMTGKRTSELKITNSSQFFLICYRSVLDQREPLYTEHSPPLQISVTRWHRLILPLDDAMGKITRLLVGNVAGEWRPAHLPTT